MRLRITFPRVWSVALAAGLSMGQGCQRGAARGPAPAGPTGSARPSPDASRPAAGPQPDPAPSLPAGAKRIEYDCVRDYSGVQGKRGWYWQSYAPGEGYRNLRFARVPGDRVGPPLWRGSLNARGYAIPNIRAVISGYRGQIPGHLSVWPGHHAGPGNAVIAWKAPAAGHALVTGGVRSGSYNGWAGNDGFEARLLVAGRHVWRRDFPDGDLAVAIPRTVATLPRGGWVRLHLGCKEDEMYDHAWVRLHITFVPTPRLRR